MAIPSKGGDPSTEDLTISKHKMPVTSLFELVKCYSMRLFLKQVKEITNQFTKLLIVVCKTTNCQLLNKNCMLGQSCIEFSVLQALFFKI